MLVPLHIYGFEVDEIYQFDIYTFELYGYYGKMKRHTTNHGYLFYNLKYRGRHRLTKLHRIIAEILVYNPNNYPCVDHIDGDRKNNHPENLRWTTQPQNTLNRKPNYNNNLPKGICRHKDKYICQVRLKGVNHRKFFTALEDAICWVRAKREELHGQFAHH